jgi:hypothetical protein
MILLVLLLHANKLNPGGFIGEAFGLNNKPYEFWLRARNHFVLHFYRLCSYVLWADAQTMMYLKISISDFLTLFAGRTRTWFFERRPGLV